MDNKFDLTFIKSKRDRDLLLRHGFKYHLNASKQVNRENTSLWRCSNRYVCSASITLNEGRDTVLRESEHTCEPDYSRNVIDIAFDACKAKLSTDFGSVQYIYEDTFQQLEDSGVVQHDDIPSFHSKRDTLYRSKKKSLKLTSLSFSRCRDVKVPDSLAKDFLVKESGDDEKILVFCTNAARKLLESSKNKAYKFYADGTFKRSPKPFKQIFSVHLDLDRDNKYQNIIPVVYCLLPNKTEETYKRCFTILKEELGVQIKHFKADFEVAQLNAVKSVYPEARISGCFFHYYDAIRRKCEEIDLNKTLIGRNIRKLCSYMTMLPTNLLLDTWMEIKVLGEACQDKVTFQQFCQYFEKQWVPLFEMLSVADENNRTTNALEGWHNRLNRKTPVKPNLLLLIQILKKEGRHFDIFIKRTIPMSRKRRLKDIQFNDKLNKKLKLLKKRKISGMEFLQKVIKAKLL